MVNRPAGKPIANGNLCLSGGWRQRRGSYVTYLIYHSGPFSSIGNALQQGEIDPCLSPFQTVEADRSGIFPTGFSQFLFSPDLQLPASCAGAVAGGRLFGAPLAGPGFPAVASPFYPAMARPAFLYAAAGSQLGGEELPVFYLGWIRGVGSSGGQFAAWFLAVVLVRAGARPWAMAPGEVEGLKTSRR